MPDSPRFSILLPTHNRAELLGYAIRSALAQTVQDFEILVVGDGCTDTTATVISSFGDPRIRWFDLPKAPGFGYANRNAALAQARGELVAFLGHDNLLFHDHLAQLAAPFADAGVHFAHSRPIWLRDDGLAVPFFVNLTLPAHRHAFLNQRNVIPATCVMHRREAFAAAGHWPEHIEQAGDYDLWKRIVNHYGPGCIRHVGIPTCLHFRADWREPRRWGPPPLFFLSSIHDSGAFWPHGLHLNLKAGAGLPQAQVWRQMEAGKEAFARQLRRATAQVQDMLSWSAGLDMNFN